MVTSVTKPNTLLIKKMCNHEDFKIAERLFNKLGKPVATAIFCLKCGSSQKIIIPKAETKNNIKKI